MKYTIMFYLCAVLPIQSMEIQWMPELEEVPEEPLEQKTVKSPQEIFRDFLKQNNIPEMPLEQAATRSLFWGEQKNVFTLLHTAAQQGDCQVMRLLLDRKAKVDAVTNEGRTPLHIAAQRGHYDAVELLLEHDAQIDTQTSSGCSALYLSLAGSQLDVAILLLKHNPDVNLKTMNDNRALHASVRYECTDTIIASLLQRSANPNAVNAEGFTALHVAVNHGRANAVKTLLPGCKASVNARISASSPHIANATPLHLAAYAGYADIIELLLDHGADIDSQADTGKFSDGLTPLHLAAQNGKLEAVIALVKRGARINAQTNKTWLTPLHVAAQRNDLSLAKYLLQNGASQVLANRSGETPEQLATQKELKQLLDHRQELF